MTSRFSTLSVAFALLVFAGASQAETGYVIDKLTIGIHADKSLDSPILKLFTTGAQLEILKREGDLIQVRGPEGETGWVEAAYLTMEEPARAMVERLEKRASELETQLKEAQEKLKSQGLTDPKGASPNSLSPAGNEASLALSQQNEVLKQQISAERLKVEQLQAKLTEAGKSAAPANSDNEALLQKLQQENQALKKSLIEAMEEIPTGRGSVMNAFLGNGYWTGLAALSLVAVAAFLSGVYWVDRQRRKRYGGFRL